MPVKRSLLKAVKGFVELEIFRSSLRFRWGAYQDVLMKGSKEKGTFNVKLSDFKFLFNKKGKHHEERRKFSGGGKSFVKVHARNL